MLKTKHNPIKPDVDLSVFQNLKWRRRGIDRRLSESCSPAENDAYVEKRCAGDRRHHLLDMISKIIFPRLKDDI